MIRILLTTLYKDWLSRRAAARRPRYELSLADSHLSVRATGHLQPIYIGSAARR